MYKYQESEVLNEIDTILKVQDILINPTITMRSFMRKPKNIKEAEKHRNYDRKIHKGSNSEDYSKVKA